MDALLAGIIGGLAASFILNRLYRARERASGAKPHPTLESPSIQPQAWAFVAMEYCWLILNRTYMVFVTDHVIAGAKVRGLIASPFSPGAEWENPQFYPRPQLLAKYNATDVESPQFLAVNRANFQLSRSQVARVEFVSAAKWGMGTVPYSGRIRVWTHDGLCKELILLGHQDGPAITARLRSQGYGSAAA